MSGMIDLHTHSTASDGTLSPAELIQLAAGLKLRVIALTDHDTTAGIPAAAAAAEKCGITLIPGIEISSILGDRDIHILGFYIDPDNAAFCRQITELVECRRQRNEKVIFRMNRDGIPVTMEDLSCGEPEAVITRAHFARYLMEKGYTASLKESFHKYMGVGCPYYIPRDRIAPEKAVSIIKKGGGMAFLAHPGIYHLKDSVLDNLLTALIRCGLDGIEVYYSLHSGEETTYFHDLAEKHHLLMSGGSDFHGSNKPDIQLGSGRGTLALPLSLYEKIEAAHRSR